MVIVSVLILILFSGLLIKSADIVAAALKRLGRETHTKTFVLSAILLALATSFPELSVGITSALQGTPQLSLGNVLGANLANIAVVVGVSTILARSVNVYGEIVKRDVAFAFIAGLLPIVLVIDRQLSRVDGLILLSSYGAYAASFFKGRFLEIASVHKRKQEGFAYRFLRRLNDDGGKLSRDLGRLFLGIALLLFSADVIVRAAISFSAQVGIPVFLVGLVVLSLGTTLPELAFSIRSLEKHQSSMFFGNILGSIIANSTVVIGLAATIHPITVKSFNDYLIAVIAFLLIFGAFWLFIRTKKRLDMWEAGVLLVLYVVFVIVEFL